MEDIFKAKQLDRYLHIIVGNLIPIKDKDFKVKYSLIKTRHKANFAAEYMDKALKDIFKENQLIISEISVFFNDDNKKFDIKLKTKDAKYVFYMSNYVKGSTNLLFMKEGYGDINDITTQIIRQEILAVDGLESLSVILSHLNGYKDLYKKVFGLNEISYYKRIRDVFTISLDEALDARQNIVSINKASKFRQTREIKKEYSDMQNNFLTVMEKLVLSDDVMDVVPINKIIKKQRL